ncbi:unnamed protein product [Adineta steineri]|uniref:BLOC-1-related complex subunit 7 n=2 Tax=Adineta steineri TaxID=433720 RepID=A0A815B270_9BILA|nr:unnamed protein product [Adineta steineri]CAF1442420.1 unnamed protein product [Adineta steineri]CAF3629799.1 unnamed protein product [Adineta steineri]CAF3817171.1 unnamed protein product [Adineta steineri]
MATPASTLPVSFTNDDVKANVCSKAQSSVNALSVLAKSIIKNSHSSDHLTTTLKQFANSEDQIKSTQGHIDRIEFIHEQLLFHSNKILSDTQELIEIHQTFSNMKLEKNF